MYTRRCRIALVLIPIWLPLLIVAALFNAIFDGFWHVGESLGLGYREIQWFIYRDVYRPARYGSVHDKESK